MNKTQIRAAVDAQLAAKGYPPGWAWWPAWGRGGRLHVLVDTEAPAGTEGIKVYRIPAPMPQWRFREIMRTIPRHGPPRQLRPKLTVAAPVQPTFDALWYGKPRKSRQSGGNGGRARETAPGGTVGRGKAGARPDAS